MKIFFTHWFPLILYALLIFYISSQRLPELPAPLQIDHIDLIAHFLEYALFAYLAYRVFRKINNKLWQTHLVFITLVISILYGFSDELHQYYVPGRQMSIFDFLANSIGVITSVSLLRIKQINT